MYAKKHRTMHNKDYIVPVHHTSKKYKTTTINKLLPSFKGLLCMHHLELFRTKTLINYNKWGEWVRLENLVTRNLKLSPYLYIHTYS